LPGKSAALRQTLSYASRLATTRLSMVIEGEPGVGKLTLARAILDSQQVIPIRIDAGADGPQSVVATLRGALEQRPDAILLQHLDAIPPEAAAPTAAMIEEFTTAAWTPRIIATLTTGQSESPLQPLQRLIDTISVGRVVIPPLRDRREDISGSATLLLGERRGARSLKFSSSALRILMRATWPGNMRQLDNTVRGLVATVAGPEIQPAHLPSHLQAQSTRRHLSSMEELELNAILGALQQYHGNKIAAAASIGISRSTLYRKLRSYHVDPDRQYF
jgi:DNA-binding NtrC family response regulator